MSLYRRIDKTVFKDTHFKLQDECGTSVGMFQLSSLTADRTFTMQDTSGTIALTSDLGTIATHDIAAIGASMLPSDTDTYNLGSAAKKWANIYPSSVNLVGAVGDISLKPYGADYGGGVFLSGIEIQDNKAGEGSLFIYANNSEGRWEIVSDNNQLLFNCSVQTGGLTVTNVTIGSGNRIYFAESGVGDTSIRADSSDNLLFEVGGVDSAYQMGTAGFIARGAGTGAAGFLLKNQTGNDRYGIKPGSAGNVGDNDDIALCNREANGVVEIQANTATAGAAGETLIARFEDDNAKIYGISYLGATTPATVSATGNLLLSAGAIGVGRYPIKFQAGTALTTPEAGVLEYHNNRLYMTNKSVRKALDRTSDVKTTTTTVDGDAGADGTTETEVFSAAVPANSWVAGNVLRMFMGGALTNKVGAGGHTVTIRVKVGGNTVATLLSTAAKFTDACWHIHGFAIVRDVGAPGHMAWHMDMAIEGDNATDACNVSEITTTGALDITVTAQWGTADAANLFDCTMGWMEYKN